MTWRDVGNLRGEMGATGPQGATGETGPAGAPFTIYRTYATIALMDVWSYRYSRRYWRNWSSR